MRVSYKWLKDLVDIDLGPEELAQKLTAAGLAVEDVEWLGQGIDKVLVGKIIEVKPHPNSDHLHICQVDLGGGGQKQIVCGAPNARAGLLTPVVLPGGTLPGGKKIGAAELRGVRSEGMLCSAAELGLEKESAGILELSGEAVPGEDIRPLLGLDDVVLEIELTANRADCQSMLGVAREVSAITGRPLRAPEISPVQGRSSAAAIRVEAQDLCPRYAGYHLKGIKDIPSPRWMQQRLTACGVRPINGVVDVTNYVMLEMNQPLHAFDLGQLDGHQVVIRRAKAGERMTTLDGTERVLEPDMLVIADAQKPVALAGIMGGANSEITPAAREVFLEGALFDATNVRRTAKKLALRTEASIRFERAGIDPDGVAKALDRAANLMIQIGAAEEAAVVSDVYPRPVEPLKINLRGARVNLVLGTDLQVAEMAGYLRRLPGVQVEERTGELLVTVPTFRRDLEEEIDLVEEIARLHGYDRIPVSLPMGFAPRLGLTRSQRVEDYLRQTMIGAGFAEVVTYSLTSPENFNRLRLPGDDPARQAVPLMQPLSEDQAILRTMLWPSVLEVAARNFKHRVTDQRIFELGRVFHPITPGELPEERRFLAGLITGRRFPQGWAGREENVDFFDLKGVVEQVLAAQGLEGGFTPAVYPSLHPGRTAQVACDGMVLGFIGEVHPRVAEAFGLEASSYVFELDVEKILAARGQEVKYRALPKYPAITRDMAFVVKKEIPAVNLVSAVKEAGGAIVEAVGVFDVYEGAPIEAGHKNIALSVVFRIPDRTLTDAEVNETEERIVKAVQTRTGGNRRG